MGQYVLRTGSEGAERLDLVERMFGEASREFLRGVGLGDGLRVLDVGCGTGTLTCWIAQVVSSRGRVIGVDAAADQLAVARKAAEDHGLTNVDFVEGRFGSDDLGLGGFDLVHCRLVLMHTPDPENVLGSMVRTARQGGIVACEETVASSAFMRPSNAVISRMSQLFCQLGMQRALDFDVGDKLFALMSRQAEQVVASRFVQPMVPLPVATRFLTLAAAEVRTATLAAGLLTESEAAEMSRAVEALGADPAAYYAPGRMAQVAGLVA